MPPTPILQGSGLQEGKHGRPSDCMQRRTAKLQGTGHFHLASKGGGVRARALGLGSITQVFMFHVLLHLIPPSSDGSSLIKPCTLKSWFSISCGGRASCARASGQQAMRCGPTFLRTLDDMRSMRVMENQMEKQMDTAMETGVMRPSH